MTPYVTRHLVPSFRSLVKDLPVFYRAVLFFNTGAIEDKGATQDTGATGSTKDTWDKGGTGETGATGAHRGHVHVTFFPVK